MSGTLPNEQNLLAIILAKPEHAARIFAAVPVDKFDPPMNLIAEAIQALRVNRQHIDPSTVTEELRRRGLLGRIGGNAVVFEIAQFYITDGSLDYHLSAVVENRNLRDLWKAGTRLAQNAENAQARMVSASDVANAAANDVQAVMDRVGADRDAYIESLAELMADQEGDAYDWVIPGLVERMDRLILTGQEGLGKTTLFRQFAIGTAAGIHPFTHELIEPQRVLVLDAENSRRQNRRKLRPLYLAALGQGRDPGDNLFIECRPEGMDLTRSDDEAWFMSRVTAVQPAVIFTGSVYKLYEGDPNDERPARRVAGVLDRARAAANCAVVLEAHAGHATEGPGGPRKVRPYGASLWMRWPEFGYGIRPGEGHDTSNRIVDFVPWRGDRDERDWPRRLRAGGTWPWAVASTFETPWTPTVHEGGGAQ